MNCPNCNRPNREGANFCKYCGNLLVTTCPRCSLPLSDAAVFCDNCGLRLRDSPGLGWWPSASTETNSTHSAPPAVSSPARPAVAPPPVRPPTSSKPPLVSTGSQLQKYIPQELKAKLDAARASSTMVGERKQVTVLFSDIVGSTSLAEKLDPEEWGEIVSGAHRRVSEAIYRYEGTIAQLLGDGVLAFFGAPITHEDDPVRAVNAALDILKSIQEYRDELSNQKRVPDFQMRVGLNTGLVVVGNIGSDMHMEYLAIGDAINLAARMEQTAEPSTIQIAQDTFKQVKPFFEFQDLGGLEVKGKSEPVQAYRVLGRKELAVRERGIEGLHAEIVGREQELSTLRNVMTDLGQGVGRIVCLLGEAGLGKSRLIHETRKVFGDLVDPDANWYETTSLSYENNQAYRLFQRLIRRVSGIGHDDSSQVIREKLTPLIQDLPEERRARATQYFDAMFGLEGEAATLPEGDAFKRELCETLRDWLRARFSNHPTVLVFDDMHWADAASIEMLRKLLSLTEEIPLVLLCALRTERNVPAWQIKQIAEEEFHHRYTEIALRPLSESESNELLNRLLAIAELPDRLRATVLEKSGGNPFFIEEVVRTLIESGTVVSEERTVDGVTRRYWTATDTGADFVIPDNLQSLLAARMDRLEESTRATLQIASVIGRSFYHRVLQAVAEATQELDHHIGTLVRLEMIREQARVPELEYAFRNPLTQEAVYQTILLKRRRGFHGRVGEAMETLFPDRLEGLYGLLAYHFAQAGQNEKAVQYSRQAARQALAVYAFDDAIQNLRAALELIDPEEQSEIHVILLEELGDVYWLVREFGQALMNFQQALDLSLSRPAGDKNTSVRLRRKIVQIATDAKWSMDAASYQKISGIRKNSLVDLQENLKTIEGEPAHPDTVHALIALAADAWRVEEPPDWNAAQHFAQAAVDMAEQMDKPILQSQALGALANVLDGRSLLRDHLQVTLKRLELGNRARLDDPREKIDTLRGAGAALMYVGEYAQALPYLSSAEEMATRVQAIDQLASALGITAQCLFRMDRWDEVLTTEAKWRELDQRYSRTRVGET